MSQPTKHQSIYTGIYTVFRAEIIKSTNLALFDLCQQLVQLLSTVLEYVSKAERHHNKIHLKHIQQSNLQYTQHKIIMLVQNTGILSMI